MIDLKPDCSNCAALCCVTLHFDKGEQFAHDKPAGTPCLHLNEDRTCKIYADLGDQGYKGCVQFDCLGAGQRVTQDMFDGQSWQENPALLPQMSEAFRLLRDVHERLSYLNTCMSLPLSRHSKGLAAALQAEHEKFGKMTAEILYSEKLTTWMTAVDKLLAYLGNSGEITPSDR